MSYIKKKILHIEGGSNLYGGPLQVYYLLREIYKKNNFDIENILICPNNSKLSINASEYAKIYSLKMNSDINFLLLYKIIKIIKKEKPDLIHLHSRKIAEFIGALAAIKCGVKCIVTRRVDNKENRLIIKAKYSMYSHIITISNGIKKVLINQGIDPKKITCVKSAVDEKFYSKPIDKIIFRKKYGFNSNSILVGMIAQFIPRKGHKKIIYIMNDLVCEYDDIHLLLYGIGPMINEIKYLISKLNLEKKIHILGFVDNIEKQIGALDMIVHPAEKEGLGVALLQASSAKVPVVTTNVGGIPEIIKNNFNGFLVSPDDKNGMKIAMKKLIENRNLRETFGKNGNKIVKKEFSIEAMINGNLDVYKKFI